MKLFSIGTSEFRTGSQARMKQSGSIELLQYWNRLRKGRPAPRRSEVEPADIKKLLADTFILERDSRGEAVFRLAGTRLCSIHGRELKGFSFASMWRLRDQRLVSRMVEGAFSSASVVVISYLGIGQKGRTCPFELLLLPLDGGDQNPRCLGIASATEAVYWLGADPITENAAESVRVLDPDRETMFLQNRPPILVPPLVPRDEDVTALPSGRRVRHLTVLDGGFEASEA